MTTSPRKRPWYARLPKFLSTAVTVHSYAAQVPDGFVRQVDVTFQIPEPGKGGTNPPTRDVIVRMNPDDAEALAHTLLTKTQAARQSNAEQGNGGAYAADYANVWAEGPGRTNRVPRRHSWGRYYHGPDSSEEARVEKRTSNSVYVSLANTGELARIPRTDADLSLRFVTDDDNWETL